MTPDQLATIRLLSLDGLGPARLAWLIAGRSAHEVVAAMIDGEAVGSPDAPKGIGREAVAGWRSAIRAHVHDASDDMLIDRYGQAGVTVLDPSSDGWPFVGDPEPPALLFARGDTSVLDPVGPSGSGERAPMVAIVGSRRCTSVGRRVAERMGAELATLGVGVVSGLALGIDGEAHSGVFKAWERAGRRTGAAIGVVASGLDVVYPKRHTDLWHRVGDAGVLVSEAPLGIAPARWRFPARNRIIAALADAVVVVESHASGGALSTVDEAEARDVPVFVVPGSVLSAASDGTNRLLVDGATPVRDGTDVVESLGLVVAAGDRPNRPDHRQQSLPLLETTIGVDDGGGAGVEADVLADVAAGSLSIEQLAAGRDLDPIALLATVQRMALAGRVVLDGNRVRLR